MGVREALASLFTVGASPAGYPSGIEWLGPAFRQMVLGLTPEELYRTQPHLRTVVSFVARNTAHLGLKAYARAADNDRERLRDDPLAQLLRRPNPQTTGYELINALVSDLALYDIAYWWVYEDPKSPSGWTIRPIPPSWVAGRKGGTIFEPGEYSLQLPNGKREDVPADQMLVFHGYNPGRPKDGASPVETLKQVLAEQVQAWSYREQVWQRGGRVGAVITRPQGATWSDTARERFIRDWKSRWTGMEGSKAGGTPILEDGMTINRLGFNAREEEWAEVSRLALATVAGAYHVPPVMVGVLDSATFASTKEFRKMLYSETLGPLLAMIEDRINAFLAPRVSKKADAYVEFNIEEKLQGDFEEQAAILSTSTGAPWMTRNEARALRNLPAVDGGDELVVPLNVLTGGQASPRDSGTQNEVANPVEPKLALGQLRKDNAVRAIKAAAPVTHRAKAEEVIGAYFDRQAKSVLSKLGTKDPEWWDGPRWDRELTKDLLALALLTTPEVAALALGQVGIGDDAYDVARTEAFLEEVAKSRAGAINSTTRAQLEASDDPAAVFEQAKASRTASIAQTLMTTLAAFATVEAAKQNGGGTKTWLVTSSNPRPEHKAMHGQTVGIDEQFSNRAKWPGDPVLGADGVAGCTCDVEVTFG